MRVSHYKLGNFSPAKMGNFFTALTVVKEYQEIYHFDVLIDFKTEEIFVFIKKKIARSFMSRMHSNGFFGYSTLYFDLQKIENITELLDIWGSWEDCNGKCKKKAYFGTEVNTLDELNKQNVTSYNVEYECENDQIIDLFIMADCRLSSRSRLIGNAELIKIYQKLKDNLGISENKEDFREFSPEEN